MLPTAGAVASTPTLGSKTTPPHTTILKCTIQGNDAAVNGGGVYLGCPSELLPELNDYYARHKQPALNVTHSIIFNNSAGASGGKPSLHCQQGVLYAIYKLHHICHV